MNVQNIQPASRLLGALTKQPTWPCVPCNLPFNDKVNLEMHQRTYSHYLLSANSTHYCLFCQNIKHRTRQEWHEHRVIAHGVYDEAQGPGSIYEQDQLRAENEKFRCLCCPYGRRYCLDEGLKRHMIASHFFQRRKGNEKISCKACRDMSFSSGTEAALHYLEWHTPSAGTTPAQSNQHTSHSSDVIRGSENHHQYGSSPIARTFGQLEQVPQVAGNNISVSSGFQYHGVLAEAASSTDASGNADDQQDLVDFPTILSEEEMETESTRIVQLLIEG